MSHSNYYGRAKENKLSETEHDYFGDDARSNFSSKDILSGNFEYINKVDSVDLNACDFYFDRQRLLRKVKKHTQDQNSFLRGLLKKRDFVKREIKLFDELNRKKIGLSYDEMSELKNLRRLSSKRALQINEKKKYEELVKGENGLTYKEDLELDHLYSIRFSNDAEKEFKRLINGLDKIYYYKDACPRLSSAMLNQNRFLEWNKTQTKSKETRWTGDLLKKASSVMIVVNKEDLVEFTKKQNRTSNPVLVNSASHINPGGSWEKGEEGSEESLFYRSSYELSLNGDEISDGFYPLVENATIYSPKIMIYKFGRDRKYASVPKSVPTMLSVIACCLPHTVEYKIKDKTKASPLYKKILTDKCSGIYKKKIKNILQTALYWGHDSVVFDSFGCAVLDEKDKRCSLLPPKHCANLFKEIIFDDQYMFYKKFKYIIFCIGILNVSKLPIPSGTNDPNLLIYQNELNLHNHETNVYKIFYQTLHDIDKFSM